MQQITFAVTGCGHIGRRHAEIIGRNPHAGLMALVEAKNDLHPELLKLYNVPVFESLEDLYQSGLAPEVMVIATPNGTHAALANRAMEQGSHVVIEKPLALSVAETDTIIETGKRTEKHIFCVMQNRYSPPSQWLKEMTYSNLLGNIYMVQINCFWNRDERYYKHSDWKGTSGLDGGTLYTQFSHFIDVMYWLFGPVKQVDSRIYNFNHAGMTDFEDSGWITFEWESGIAGQFNFSTSVYEQNLESSITIIAEHGTIRVGGQYMEKITYCHIKDYEMPELPPTNPANDYGVYKGSAANHHYIIQNVIAVLNGQAEIHTPVGDGRAVVKMIEQFYGKSL